MIPDIDELVIGAVRNVYDTMLNIKVAIIPQQTVLPNGGCQHVASSVGFIGRLTGVVYLHTTAAFAKRITGLMLGLQDHEIEGDEMVNDAMGEIANMVVGNLKSCLSDRGMPCVLTIPSVVRGSSFSIEAVSSTEGRVFAFSCNPDQMLVELLIKATE
jgi:chemotaxis protein CheX